MKGFLLFFCFSLAALEAASVRLINNSPYELKAVIRGSDGQTMGAMTIKSEQEITWSSEDTPYKKYGSNPTRSQTPYTVWWYCPEGEDYGMCDTVSTGAVVMAQGCTGPRACKPKKKPEQAKPPSHEEASPS
ncbi:MAG: hypothetical protein JSS61_02545 [Verrucomicrobia bacterium]|nr:hypothetical protein [Verrucomicrobiota bacterium]